MVIALVLLLAQVTTPPADDNGELTAGIQYMPATRLEVCLVKSKPPKELASVIDCKTESEREFCSDETSYVLDDKLIRQQLFKRYPGSFIGQCERKEQ